MAEKAENVVTQRRSVITKQKILLAAEQEFAAKGIHGTRVDEIAKRADVNKRMMYIYFGNKEDLYIAVLDDVFSHLSSLCKSIVEADSVADIVSGYFKFLNDNPDYVKLALWENMNDDGYFEKSEAPKYVRALFGALTEKFELYKKKGEFKADLNCQELAVSLNAMCLSAFSNINTAVFASGGHLNAVTAVKAQQDVICRMAEAYAVT